MGNISYASDAEIVAAWRLLHGEDVAEEFGLRKEGDAVVSKTGTCELIENADEAEGTQWTVNKQHLRLIMARRGIELDRHRRQRAGGSRSVAYD